jgi:hypothetical protein
MPDSPGESPGESPPEPPVAVDSSFFRKLLRGSGVCFRSWFFFVYWIDYGTLNGGLLLLCVLRDLKHIAK